jgi:feruloyl esterase
MRHRLWRRFAVGLAAAGLAFLGLEVNAARAASPCESLTDLKLAHVTITAARLVEKAPFGPAGQPATPTYCKVLGTARPTSDSDIRFEVAIPEGQAWNGRYLQVGNGGFAGNIPERSILVGLAQGYATAGTDDGHESVLGTDASWAMGHPEKVVDFGYRALKETTDAAKAIIAAHADRAPRYSYFLGCSDGGREALMEAQRYPDDFDGVVAGDPANHWTHLLAGAAWNAQALNATPASAVPAAKLAALEAAALKACGDQDGIVENPLTCRFDPGVLRCKGADSNTCLTTAQVTAVRKIYAGARNPRTGARILAGYSPGGEGEAGGWSAWITGPGQGVTDKAAQSAFAHNFFAYVLFGDPNYDIRKLDLDVDVRAADAKYAPIFNSYDPDLSAFRRHGGKLIQFHGWADPAIPAGDSIDYFQAVQARMGHTAGFYRLFLAPGMLHCGGGRGPNQVGMPALAAVTAWVEHGAAPNRLVVRQTIDNDPTKPLLRTRPLCAYPKVAQWNGRGARASAENWVCGPPIKRT